jgi:hypothetical protein
MHQYGKTKVSFSSQSISEAYLFMYLANVSAWLRMAGSSPYTFRSNASVMSASPLSACSVS